MVKTNQQFVGHLFYSVWWLLDLVYQFTAAYDQEPILGYQEGNHW